MASVFETLNSINVKDYTEQKNGLTYLSWAHAWKLLKQQYPEANYKVYETPEGVNYFTDGLTAWVKTSIIVEGIEHIEYLPIMDYRNRSIPVDKITSFDVNKSIQRSLTKATARHGLGLYIYAGEDLPGDSVGEAKQAEQAKQAKQEEKKADEWKGEPELASKAQKNMIKRLCDATNEKKPGKYDPVQLYGKFKCTEETCTAEMAGKILAWFNRTYPGLSA